MIPLPFRKKRILSTITSVLRKGVDGLLCGPLCDRCYAIALHINFVLSIHSQNHSPVFQNQESRKSKSQKKNQVLAILYTTIIIQN